MRTEVQPRGSSWLGVREAVCASAGFLGLFLFGAAAVFGADKSGVSPNSISLPKGPGSIEGLGESFQPTLNTGTAKYGIALKVPPGTAGQTPSLGLSYEGGGGNGALGFGWQLSVPSIQRQTDKGIPLYGTNLGLERVDAFINDIKEELVPTARGDFFCKNEGAFVRYRFVPLDSRPSTSNSFIGYWEGSRPDGTRLEFGTSLAGRVAEGTNRIFCWMLEREIDTRNNAMVYSYTNFPGDHNLHQTYLSQICYGPGPPPWGNFHFIQFVYEDRPDWFEDCRSGFPIRTGKRLKSILIGTQGSTLPGHQQGDLNGDGITDNLVRRYDLAYLDYAGTNSHWSLLAKVTLVGADGTNALPASCFGYSLCNPANVISALGTEIGALNPPPQLMDTGLTDLNDLNGDGLPDLLMTDFGGGSHRAYLNLGETTIAGSRFLRWTNGGHMGGDVEAWALSLGSTSVHLSDLDGDGLADFVVNPGFDVPYYFRNSGRTAWKPKQNLAADPPFPPSPFGATGVRTADVDFDKRTDLIQSVSTGGSDFDYSVWFNLGSNRYAHEIRVPQDNGFDLALPTTQIADFNGDRVPDLCSIGTRQVVITAGLGYGRFASPQTVAIPPFPPGNPFWRDLTDELAAPARLTDLTGDGLADLIIEKAPQNELWYWINLGNYTFNVPHVVTGIPQVATIRWADMNGNGTTDLVLADSTTAPSLQVFDLGELLNCGATPNLLTAISNGIGRVTLIAYAPSTRFMLDDAAAGQAWTNSMPFPVTVVSCVTNLDSIGHQYLTKFRYHDGYYDALEKQFRGFARVEQVDVGDVTAPTLVTRSHFDTGGTYEAMKGKLLRLTAETAGGGVFKDDFTAWQLPPRILMTGTNGQPVHYTHPTSTTNILKELGKGIERRLESEMAYDNFGNQTMDADYGVVENGNRAAFDDERISVTDFAVNTNAWILRTPKRSEIRDGNGAVISRTDLFYDDETFSGNNWGIVTIGNLTLKRDWISPSNSTATISSTRTKFDAYGSPITILDPLASAAGGSVDFSKGHSRQIAYDSRFHTYPITETIHLGGGKAPLIFQASYDEGFGTVANSTDFNANTTTYGYDTFARLISIVKPGDTPIYPTVEYDYALAVPFPRPLGGGEGPGEGVINYVETRQRDKSAIRNPKSAMYLRSRQFVDGLGRKLITKQEAEPAPGSSTPRVVVTEAVQFNARQKPVRVLNPFFSASPLPPGGEGQGEGALNSLLAFENIEAPGWQGQFHQEGSLVTLNLSSAHVSSTVFDAMLRPVQNTNPDGTQRRTVYEPLITRSFDENDNDPASPYHDTPMVHANDGLGRLVRVEEISRLNDDGTPAGTLKIWTTLYQYDLHDQLTQITDSQNNIKTFGYDGLKRKTAMNDPDRGVMHFFYDEASNLIETTDARSQRISYTYDGANRIRTEKYHDGEPAPAWRSSRGDEALTNSVVYHYDEPFPNLPQGDNTMATGQNTRGALAWVEDRSGDEHTSYDSRGRVEWVVKRIPDPQILSLSALGGEGRGEVALISYKTAFAYDSLDRLTNLTYPDADQLRYEYNDRNLLQRIPAGFTGGPAQSANILSNLLYLPSGQVAQIDYGNGVRTTSAYDSRLRLKRLNTLAPPRGEGQGEGLSLIDFAYEFDGVSNIKSIEDRRPGSAVAAGDPRRNTQVFQYDDLYRLTRVQYSFAVPNSSPSPLGGERAGVRGASNDGEISYRYDRIGNMLAQTSTLNHQEKSLPMANLGQMDSGGAAGRWNRTGRAANDPPGPHALSKIRDPRPQTPDRNFPYDSNGNMTNIDGLVCTWDFKDRLVAVENAEMRAAYTYDYTDRRITKRVIPKTPDAKPETPTAVSYVNKYFEVREHDAPTKYVWNGNTRVARVTGSLTTNVRVQRLRVHPGWNFCSVAVNGPLSASGGEGQGDVVSAAFKWNAATQDWEPVTLGVSLHAGTVFWLQATTNATLTITGTYADPTNRAVTAGGDFLPSAGLEIWNLKSAISNLPSATAWTYDAAIPRWLSWLPPPLELPSDLPAFLAPGQAVFTRAAAAALLEVPNPASRIRYYHQDHVGSSSSLTDAQGGIVEETALFPFGQPRHEFRTRGTTEAYQFAQKERDFESKLHYVEARYLTASLSRFTRVDTMAIRLEPEILEVPQGLNPYAYSLNNPLKFHDPSGDVWGLLGKVAKVIIKGGDIASTVAGVVDDVRTLRDSNASGWEKAGAVLSLASEVLSPVSIKDVKAGVKTVNAMIDARKALNRADNAMGALPKLSKTLAGTFEGAPRSRTFKKGETLYRSPRAKEAADTPGRFFGTRRTTTRAGTDSQYNIEMHDNPLDRVRTYELTEDVTVYYGKVKGGKGYQALFPGDVDPADVMKVVDEVKLK